MKTTLRTCISSIACALALSAFGQDLTPSPAATTSTTPTSAPVAPAVATASPSASADDLESRIDRKVKKGLHISIGDDERDHDRKRNREHHESDSDGEDLGTLMAIPIVGIIFSAIFGTPVMIVAAIMFFSYLRSRSLHRTVRSMVEKGQEVPAALFVTPPVIRARSDMRRGVVLIMVGIGLMVFFGAVNDWEGGSWALGVIPFLIGAGYLLVWKLEGNKPTAVNTSTDNIPRVP